MEFQNNLLHELSSLDGVAKLIVCSLENVAVSGEVNSGASSCRPTSVGMSSTVDAGAIDGFGGTLSLRYLALPDGQGRSLTD